MAAAVYACVHSDKTIYELYLNMGRKLYEPDNRKYFGFFTNG